MHAAALHWLLPVGLLTGVILALNSKYRDRKESSRLFREWCNRAAAREEWMHPADNTSS